MNDETTTPAPAKKHRAGAVLLFYLIDACLFASIIFQGVQNNLLWREGLYGAAAAVGLHALCIALLAALHAGHLRFAPAQPKRKRRFNGFILELAVYIFFSVPLTLFTFVVPNKGKPDFAWLPLEWHKLPQNVVLLAKITPVLFAVEIVVFILLAYLFCAKGKRLLPAIVSGLVFAVVFVQLFTLSKESNLIFYFCQYAAIPLAMFMAALLNRPRMFTRAAFASALVVLLYWQYIGVAPWNPRPAQMPDKSVSVIYPRAGAKPDFPLVFFRDFYVDSKRNMLFTAYGPTSGLVRLDLSTGEVKIIPTPTGLVRYIWTSDDIPTVYAIDWIKSDLMVIDKDTFTEKRYDIYRRDASIPFSLAVAGGKLYITSTEPPGLTEYDLHNFQPTRTLDLQPYTRFHSGVWRMTYDPGADKLFIEIGYTGLNNENKLLRVDRKTMAVDGVAEIPAGGLEMLLIPSLRRVITASFFTTSLWEFDMDTMKFVRRIEGPINCRNMAYDEKRGLIYATSFLGGTLHAIRYSDGKTIKKLRLGNKASSLFLSPDPGHKTLYLGNSWGVLKMDLDSFVGPANN